MTVVLSGVPLSASWFTPKLVWPSELLNEYQAKIFSACGRSVPRGPSAGVWLPLLSK